MKIAILLCGHIRNFYELYDTYKKNLLDLYDCHIFISSYEDPQQYNIITDLCPLKYNFDKIIDIEKKIQNMYDNYTIEIPNGPFNSTINNELNINGPLQKQNENFKYDKIATIPNNAIIQFYKIEDALKLMMEYSEKNKINYDFVLRMRFDTTILKKVILDKNLKDDKIYTTIIQNYENSIKVHDHFFYGRYGVMCKFLKIYSDLNNIIKYINECGYFIPSHGYQESICLFNAYRLNYTFVDAQTETDPIIFRSK